MVSYCYILALLIILYWLSFTCYSRIILRICFFYFLCVDTPAFISALFRHLFVWFFPFVLIKPPFLFTPFSFSSLTLFSLSSFLRPFIPIVTSLFFLTITKSKVLVLLSSSESSSLLVLQFYLAVVLFLIYLILSLVFDHLYLFRFYFESAE